MGVEYVHFVFAKDRTFFPSASQLSLLIQELIKQRYLPAKHLPKQDWYMYSRSHDGKEWGAGYEYPIRDPKATPAKLEIPYPPTREWITEFDSKDLSMGWNFCDSWSGLAITHPLASCYSDGDELAEADYAIELSRTADYIDFGVDMFLQKANPLFRCGRGLAYTGAALVNSNRIFYSCPGCKTIFEANKYSGWACLGPVDERSPQDKKKFSGGALARFAISVSVGRMIPDKNPEVEPAFLKLCENILNQDIVQCGEMA